MCSSDLSVRREQRISVDLPELRSTRGRGLAELVGSNQSIHVTGGMRLGLVGDNGVGKSTLLGRMVRDATSTGSVSWTNASSWTLTSR